MGETLQIIESRRSCRAYKPDMVPDELIEKVLRAGTYAATGQGKQSPIIIAVTNKEVRDKISAVNGQIMGKGEGFDPFYGAPVILIVLASKERGTRVYDGSLVLGNMMLAAEDLGLASCWIHRAQQTFEMPEWKEFLKQLGVEGEYEGIGNLALGYAAAPAREAAPRKADYVYYVK